MTNIRTLRNKTSGVAIGFDLSNVAHMLQYKMALETGIYVDDSELSAESSEPTEDELRAELAALRTEYEALEQRQDEIQLQIRKLAKLLPEDEQVEAIQCPF
jgi:hypothetical protein